jgi:hypothetical protein
VRLNRKIKFLVHVLLHNWDVVLEVKDEILVQEVVGFIVHTLHDVVSYFLMCVHMKLETAFLRVTFEVPREDFQNVCVMVENHNLQDILMVFTSICLDNFNDFILILKLNIYVFEDFMVTVVLEL